MIHEKIPLLSSSFQCFSCNSILGCKVLPDRKILIYCINCLTFKIFSLNEDLLINNLHLQNNNTNEILCKKCNKSYCLKCYLDHEDYIEQIQMKTVKIEQKIRDLKRRLFKLRHILPIK